MKDWGANGCQTTSQITKQSGMFIRGLLCVSGSAAVRVGESERYARAEGSRYAAVKAVRWHLDEWRFSGGCHNLSLRPSYRDPALQIAHASTHTHIRIYTYMKTQYMLFLRSITQHALEFSVNSDAIWDIWSQRLHVSSKMDRCPCNTFSIPA